MYREVERHVLKCGETFSVKLVSHNVNRDRGQMTGIGNRDQETGNREQGIGNREQGTGQGDREQGAGNRDRGTKTWCHPRRWIFEKSPHSTRMILQYLYHTHTIPSITSSLKLYRATLYISSFIPGYP